MFHNDITKKETTARVIAVQGNIVTIESLPETDRPIIQNEVIYILPGRGESGFPEYIKAEVLRIFGQTADAQVFEHTVGIGVGDLVKQSGELLSIELGPGLLGQIFDGLQNRLDVLATERGFFLPRGVAVPALDRTRLWTFTSSVVVGDKVEAGAIIGWVPEGRFNHDIMIPFDTLGTVQIVWIQEGSVMVGEPVARYQTADGRQHSLALNQSWPVRKPLPASMVQSGRATRLYPNEALLTHLRLIDTFFPIAKGGTACIPGPFGAGKTVLQNLIARNSDVDVVVIVACGERAGEVVETITQFPALTDVKGGGNLMERTIIICNTSSMPVAAREASVYTGVTIGEYYRQMGLDVLLIADSTSRWAQALRETSGRLEEIPGEEAFPAYLDSTIKSIYERAGVVRSRGGKTGSLTMIGTVSPAGGNFEEPVTQATLGTVKAFLGLSSDRAYKRFYPAVDPLMSWSRYWEQLQGWFETHVEKNWPNQVKTMLELLKQGDSINQLMQVTGESGIALDDFVIYQQAQLLDRIYLQQDAFDVIDVAVPIRRQQELFSKLLTVISHRQEFANQDEVRSFFTRLTGFFKNLNYAGYQTPGYFKWQSAIDQCLNGLAEPKRSNDPD